MFFAAINLSLFEFVILLMGATILGVTVHFFLASRKSLQQYYPADYKKVKSTKHGKGEPEVAEPSSIDGLDQDLLQLQERLQQLKGRGPGEERGTPKGDFSRDELILTLKQTISQQQKALDEVLTHIENLQDQGKEVLRKENEQLQEVIHKLETALEGKEEEMDSLRQQAEMARNMTTRIDEVYQEFEQLQQQMRSLELQAATVSNSSMELEDLKEAYEQARRDVLRKQEKLEEAITENQRIRQQLNETEDKLAEANLQRQQLQKKVQFLQELNNDLQNISETNKRLQNELRRIGELESMLQMISQERDQLLRRQGK